MFFKWLPAKDTRNTCASPEFTPNSSSPETTRTMCQLGQRELSLLQQGFPPVPLLKLFTLFPSCVHGMPVCASSAEFKQHQEKSSLPSCWSLWQLEGIVYLPCVCLNTYWVLFPMSLQIYTSFFVMAAENTMPGTHYRCVFS